MRNQLFLKTFLPGLLLWGLAAAQDKAASPDKPSQPDEKSEAAVANRKAYDALYSDIIKTLPQEGKSKVDSARGREGNAGPKQDAHTQTPDELKKNALEKRKKELDELPPDVKARVDKVLSGLDNRRKEKQTEFKELK